MAVDERPKAPAPPCPRAKIQHSTRVLCCCSAGQCRSVSAKYVLTDRRHMRSVLSMGLDKTDPETARILFDWAEVILVVGEVGLVEKVPKWHRGKVLHCDVGEDCYFQYTHKDLTRQLEKFIGEHFMAETSKSRARRVREGWFEKYAPDDRSGIDIGCQRDFLNHTFRRWDLAYGDGDATLMEDVPDETFHTVYASHVLEHLAVPVTAVRNWYRILRPGGHLIICVPHRDLYEKKKTLPSRWNADHKTYWLPDAPAPADLPHTRGLRRVVSEAAPGGEVLLLRILNEGFESHGETNHSGGEYSIEVIIRKPARESVRNGN